MMEVVPHPLQVLERAARDYDMASRQSMRCDNAAKHAAHGAQALRARFAAEARAFKLYRSEQLQEAAISFVRWKERQK